MTSKKTSVVDDPDFKAQDELNKYMKALSEFMSEENDGFMHSNFGSFSSKKTFSNGYKVTFSIKEPPVRLKGKKK